jgi:hypothetical protein
LKTARLIKEGIVSDDDEKDKPTKDSTRPWAEVMLIIILIQIFWWFMFATPFMKLLERLCAGIDRISPP